MTDVLLESCLQHLPEGEPIFSEDELTDQSLRVLCSEIVREKLLQATGDEIPYVTAVATESLRKSAKTSLVSIASSLSSARHKRRS